MTRNAEMFEMVADVIELLPNKYDQGEWGQGEDIQRLAVNLPSFGRKVIECGTAHCVAGWTAIMAGLHPTVYRNHLRRAIFRWDVVANQSNACCFEGKDVDDVAAQLLGITFAESRVLFNGGWSHGEEPAEVARRLRKIGHGEDVDAWGV